LLLPPAPALLPPLPVLPAVPAPLPPLPAPVPSPPPHDASQSGTSPITTNKANDVLFLRRTMLRASTTHFRRLKPIPSGGVNAFSVERRRWSDRPRARG
jgi:hypothetical protein